MVLVLLLVLVLPVCASKVTIKDATATTPNKIGIQLNREWKDNKCPAGGTPARNTQVWVIDLNVSGSPVPQSGALTGFGAKKTIVVSGPPLIQGHGYLISLTDVDDCISTGGHNTYGNPLHIEAKAGLPPSAPPQPQKPGSYNLDLISSEVSFDILRPELNGDVQKLSAVPAAQTKDKRFHELGFKDELRFEWNMFKYARLYTNELLDIDSKKTRNAPNPLTNSPRPATLNLITDSLKFDTGWMLHPWNLANEYLIVAGGMELQPLPVRRQFLFDDIRLTEFDVDLKRAKYPFGKAGFRWQKKSQKQLQYVEGGYKDGVTLTSIQEIDFPTASGVPVRCPASATQDLDTCAKNNRSVIRGNGTALTDAHRQHGLYMDMVWQPSWIPKLLSFGTWRQPTLKLENHASYYFTHRNTDLVTDTRLTDTFTPSVKIPVYGGFALEPSVEFFWFENKTAEDSFHRTRYKLKISYTFGCNSSGGCTW